jgi:hypothetical protein
MDLGTLRPRAPDNAADHVRRDREVLRANLLSHLVAAAPQQE